MSFLLSTLFFLASRDGSVGSCFITFCLSDLVGWALPLRTGHFSLAFSGFFT